MEVWKCGRLSSMPPPNLLSQKERKLNSWSIARDWLSRWDLYGNSIALLIQSLNLFACLICQFAHNKHNPNKV